MMLLSTNMFTRKVNSKSYYLMLYSAAVMLSLTRYQTANYMAKNFDHSSRRAHLEEKLNLPEHISSSSSTARIGSISVASMNQQTKAQPVPPPPPVLNSTPALIPTYQVDNLLIQQGDSIYLRQGWDAAPIVLEEYKLLFFTTAKVGCTVWKQLFRRMMGYEDWKAENTENKLPWNPEANGLKYLYHYSRQEASEMMTSPEWTRAIFVRDPKERFLSAYLDKVVQNPSFTRHVCCPHKMNCASNQTSLEEFLQLAQTCENHHWAPQSRRMEPKFWPFINFIGHMDTVAADAERLLRLVGGDECWKKYGATGWGEAKKEIEGAIFASSTSTGIGTRHATAAKDRLKLYYTPELERKVDQYCMGDYHVPVMNLTKREIYSAVSS